MGGTQDAWRLSRPTSPRPAAAQKTKRLHAAQGGPAAIFNAMLAWIGGTHDVNQLMANSAYAAADVLCVGHCALQRFCIGAKLRGEWVRSWANGISADRVARDGRLRLLPCRRPFQGNAAALRRLSQRRDCGWQIREAPADQRDVRKLPLGDNLPACALRS